MAVGRKVESVNIIAVESAAPFDVAVFKPDGLLMEWADKECLRIARRYIECRDAGAFPGQHVGPQTLFQPQYADELIQSIPGEELDPSMID